MAGKQGEPPRQTAQCTKLGTYTVSVGEQQSEAILAAFQTTDIRYSDKETALYDWVDREALNDLFAKEGFDGRLITVIWGRPVVITPEQIDIYAPPME